MLSGILYSLAVSGASKEMGLKIPMRCRGGLWFPSVLPVGLDVVKALRNGGTSECC